MATELWQGIRSALRSIWSEGKDAPQAPITEALRVATRTLSADVVARELRVSREVLTELDSGDRGVFARDKSLAPRVEAWLQTAFARFLRPEDAPVLPFDHLQDFWVNFYSGPRQTSPGLSRLGVSQPTRRTRLAGLDLNFPFGVPACALTPNASYIQYFAERGFDLMTYKTVRDRPWNPHPYPQWGFVSSTGDEGEIDPEKLLADERPVKATLVGPPATGRRTSLVNSFGVPSLPPVEWQADVEASRALLKPGQILIVSVMGSPEEAKNLAELIGQFTTAATMARDAGAQIIELNLSCPNSRGLEPVCNVPQDSARIIKAVAKKLASSATPLFVKIGFLDRSLLQESVSEYGGYVQGIVAINTIAVPVVNENGQEFFPGRPAAGLSGPVIKNLGLSTVRALAEDRKQGYDYAIVGVGGVTSGADFDAYRDAGADAVQSCSGAWLNPALAVEIRSRLEVPEGELDQALDRFRAAMEQALVVSDEVPAYAKSHISSDK